MAKRVVKLCYEQENKQTLFKCQRNIFHKLTNESEGGREDNGKRQNEVKVIRERKTEDK